MDGTPNRRNIVAFSNFSGWGLEYTIVIPLNVLAHRADMQTGDSSEMCVLIYDEHHQVSSLLKVHQNVHNSVQYDNSCVQSWTEVSLLLHSPCFGLRRLGLSE